MSGKRIRLVSYAVALATGLACDAPAGPASLLQISGSVVVFLTQTEIPSAMMDALLEQPVARDHAGCLRAPPDNHTIIWPKGFTLDPAGGTLIVRDSSGRSIGRIGEPFKLGGGEVASLHDGIALSDADRELAHTRCPGRYWIVGEATPATS